MNGGHVGYMSHGYLFSLRARHVFDLARADAAEHRHALVTPAHLLLAILNEGESVAAVVLRNLGVNRTALEHDLKALLPASEPAIAEVPPVEWSQESRVVIEGATHESHLLNHAYFSVEHLLLAMLREPTQAIASVCHAHGLTIANAMGETKRILGSPLAV